MNHHPVTWHEGSAVPACEPVPGLPHPRESSPESEQADARLLVHAVDGRVAAHAALWWSQTPPCAPGKLGAIGGFAADGPAAAFVLLEEACRRLARHGCALAAGPINGNTWRRYRLVTAGSVRGPFLLEPRNPPEYPVWWEQAGFTTLACYSSSLVALDGTRTVPAALEQRLRAAGVTIRGLDPGRFDAELEAIHRVTLASFTRNFLYTPLDRESFAQAYQRIRDRIDPRFVRLAERDGQACGYVFAIPDLEAAARGEQPALIVKTLAVDPASRCAGLGSLLVDQVQQLARQAGTTEVIHALQHESNSSLRITARNQGSVLRRYALYSKTL